MTSTAAAARTQTVILASIDEQVSSLARDVSRDLQLAVPVAPKANVAPASDSYAKAPFKPVSGSPAGLTGFVGVGFSTGAALCLDHESLRAHAFVGAALIGLASEMEPSAALSRLGSAYFDRATMARRLIATARQHIPASDTAALERLRVLTDGLDAVQSATLEMSNVASPNAETVREARAKLSRVTASA